MCTVTRALQRTFYFLSDSRIVCIRHNTSVRRHRTCSCSCINVCLLQSHFFFHQCPGDVRVYYSYSAFLYVSPICSFAFFCVARHCIKFEFEWFICGEDGKEVRQQSFTRNDLMILRLFLPRSLSISLWRTQTDRHQSRDKWMVRWCDGAKNINITPRETIHPNGGPTKCWYNSLRQNLRHQR